MVDNIQTEPMKGETSEQFKARIEETRRDLERQKALTPSPVPASSPAPLADGRIPEQVNTSGTVANPQNVPAAPAITGNKEVDDWWAKKGFKSQEDLERSYRELERELSKKNMELANNRQSPPVPPVQSGAPNGYPPYYNAPGQPWMAPPPAAPAPAYVQMPPQQTVEQLAEQYGLTPEDFKKVYAVANDLSKVNVQSELNRVMPGVVNQVRQVNAEVTRQREMVDLISEPTWKNPQVQFEMHKVLNEDPSIIQRQPLPYRYAHDEALKRIARVNLGGPNGFQPPPTSGSQTSNGSRPPAVAGSNGKGVEVPVGGQGKQEMGAEEFAALPLDKKRQFLQGLGAVGR